MACVLGCLSALATSTVVGAQDPPQPARITLDAATSRHRINGSIYIDRPRTAEEFAIMEEQLRAASDLICDYTDGAFALGDISVSNHPLLKREAFAWWYSQRGRAVAGVGNFGSGPREFNDCTLQWCAAQDANICTQPKGGVTYLYGVGNETASAEVIAHELGHLVFGALDHYPDQSASDATFYRSASFIGPPERDGYFRSIQAPYRLLKDFVRGESARVWETTDPIYPPPADPGEWFQANNSIMQQAAGQICVDMDGMPPTEYAPVSQFDRYCLSALDAVDRDGNAIPDGIADDCQANADWICTVGPNPQPNQPPAKDELGGVCTPTDAMPCSRGAIVGSCELVGFPFCAVVGSPTDDTNLFSSELSTTRTHDVSRWNRAFDAPSLPTDLLLDSHVRAARHVVLAGSLYPSIDPTQHGVGLTGQPGPTDGSTGLGDTSCANRPSPVQLSDFEDTPTPCLDGDGNGVPDHCATPTDPLMCTRPGRMAAACPTGSPAGGARCDRCILASSAECNPAPTCGNGIFEPGSTEHCEGPAAGVLPDPFEALSRCADIGYFGGTVRCQDNCLFDMSECALPFMDEQIRSFDASPPSLGAAAAQSTLSRAFEVYDADGKVRDRADFVSIIGTPFRAPLNALRGLELEKMGPSNHGLFTFFRRMLRFRVPLDRSGNVCGPDDEATEDCRAWEPDPNHFNEYPTHHYHEVWQLIIAMDAAEFENSPLGRAATSGRMKVVRQFELEFDMDYTTNSGTLVAINGVGRDDPSARGWQSDLEEDWPVIFLGYDSDQASMYDGTAGDCQFDGSRCGQAQEHTGFFHRQECEALGDDTYDCFDTDVVSPAMTLRLDLRKLGVGIVESWQASADNPALPANAEEAYFRPLRSSRGSPYASVSGPVSAYARHGVVTGAAEQLEIPQYGHLRYRHRLRSPECQSGTTCCYACNTDGTPTTIPAGCTDHCAAGDAQANFYRQFGFNDDTQNFESSGPTLHFLARRAFGSARPGYRSTVGAPEPFADIIADPDTEVDSDWTTLSNVMCMQHGILLSDIPQTPQDIDINRPADCPPFAALTGKQPIEWNEDTQIVFVLDHSGSMGVFDQGFDRTKRLDFVKTAARAMLDDVLFAAKADGPDPCGTDCRHGPSVGLVWFSSDAQVVIPVPETADPPNIEAVCDTGDSECTDTSDGVQVGELDVETVKQFMTPTKVIDASGQVVDAVEFPEAGGATATGTALQLAGTLFRDRPGVKVLVTLTDGGANQPEGGGCLGRRVCEEIDEATQTCTRITDYCRQVLTAHGDRSLTSCMGWLPAGSAECQAQGKAPDCLLWDIAACSPTTEAQKVYRDELSALQSQGVVLFDVPLGAEANPGQAVQLAASGLGGAFPTTDTYGEDTVPTFLQLFSALRGQELARTHLELPVQVTWSNVELTRVLETHPIRVENGATQLVVRLSDADTTAQDFRPDRTHLLAPDNRIYEFDADPHSDAELVKDPKQRTYYIDDPLPGTWYVQSWVPTSVGPYRSNYVAAHVENDNPGCRATLSTSVTDGSEPVQVAIEALWQRPLTQGVTYRAQLTRPDLLVVDLDVVQDPVTEKYSALVPTSEMVGRGVYKINVTCDVGSFAKPAPGEGGPDDDPAVPLEPERFKREVALQFFHDTDVPPPIPSTSGLGQDPDVLEAVRLRDCGGAQLAAIRAFGRPGLGGSVSCTVPPEYAPSAPKADGGDFDGDGIDDADPREDPGRDDDGDGTVNPLDPDSNGNGVQDGCDSAIVGATAALDCCVNVDGIAPTIVAPDLQLTDCNAAPAITPVLVRADDSGCPDTSLVELVGVIQDVNGEPRADPVRLSGGRAVLELEVGVTTILWSAIDPQANFTFRTQTIECCGSVFPDPPASVQAEVCDGSNSALLTLTPPATQSSCGLGSPSVTGEVVDVDGKAVSIPVDPVSGEVLVPVGNSVVEWTAVDVNGNTAVVQQTVSVSTKDDPSCCASGQILVEGNGWPNTLLYLDWRSYCIFGKGGGDTIHTGTGSDYLSGGTSHDLIKASGSDNVILGGDGNDWLEMPFGNGSVYGGPGDDVVEDTSGGVIYGNAGDDFIETDLVAHQIIPGPGRDAVYGGTGDDTVVIYDACEVEPFEVLKGGLGNDTLISPLSAWELFLRGVTVSGFETIIVTDDNRHLSECF